MANKNLNAAKTAKKDEFYTQLTDIERELQHYWPHFRDKVVLCNCDDPYESNFFKYFALRFNQLGLRKLICTCYNGSPVQGNELMIDFGDFSDEPKKIAYKVEITEVRDLNGDGAVDLSDVRYLLQNDKNVLSTLKTGDFRDPECIELLKQADIVVTNPPFSLFREYIGQLMENNKKFLIIGHQRAIQYKEIIPLIMDNKIWMGYGFNISLVYKSPYKNELEANRKYVRSKGYDPDHYIKVPAIAWYTNLEIAKRHEEIDLVKKYTPEEYKTYDNFDAIEVPSVTDIPLDYQGIMGVPITFMDKYNPSQFEILGVTGKYGLGLESTKTYDDFNEFNDKGEKTGCNGKKTNGNPMLKGFPPSGNYYQKGDEIVHSLYTRILIRNKHPQTNSQL